jgi:hypothetical protein
LGAGPYAGIEITSTNMSFMEINYEKYESTSSKNM